MPAQTLRRSAADPSSVVTSTLTSTSTLASASTITAATASPRIAVDAQAIEDLDAAICRLARHLHAETYRMLLLIRDFDDRFGFVKWSFRSCAEWLAWRCQLSLSAAREQVRTAHALRTLPAISAAFAEGRLSYSKVRALTRVAGLHDEDLLLAYALEATAAQVEERCRQMRNVAPESIELARRVWERRSLSVSRHPHHGTLLITVEVPIEDGEVIVRALESAVAAGEVAVGVDYAAAHGVDRGADRGTTDGWRAQQADALVVVAKAYLAGGVGDTTDTTAERVGTLQSGAPPEDAEQALAEGETQEQKTFRPIGTSVADHYQMIVHVDEQALRGGGGRADLPLDVVKRITCDGSLIALVEDERGTPLALGRKQRVVTTALKRALWSRDRGCTFPGCHRQHYVDAHHIRHWANGGETSLANLTLLCSYHHRLLHEGGFRVRRCHDGALDFMRADGRVIPRSGYRLEDRVDSDVDEIREPSAEGFCTATVHAPTKRTQMTYERTTDYTHRD